MSQPEAVNFITLPCQNYKHKRVIWKLIDWLETIDHDAATSRSFGTVIKALRNKSYIKEKYICRRWRKLLSCRNFNISCLGESASSSSARERERNSHLYPDTGRGTALAIPSGWGTRPASAAQSGELSSHHSRAQLLGTWGNRGWGGYGPSVDGPMPSHGSGLGIRPGAQVPCGNCTHLEGGSIGIPSLLPYYMNSSSNCGKQVSVWDGVDSDLTRGAGLSYLICLLVPFHRHMGWYPTKRNSVPTTGC